MVHWCAAVCNVHQQWSALSSENLLSIYLASKSCNNINCVWMYARLGILRAPCSQKTCMFISMEFAQFAQTMSSSSRYWLVISCNIHHLNWVSIFIQYIHIYKRYVACNVQQIRCIYKTVYCIIITIPLQTSQISVQSKRLKIFHQSLKHTYQDNEQESCAIAKTTARCALYK